MIAAAAKAALGILIEEPHRVARAQALAESFLMKAREAGLDTGCAVGRGIIPIIFSEMNDVMDASQSLFDAAIFAPPIVRLGFGKKEYRIRFFVSAAHLPEHIDAAINVLASQKDRAKSEHTVLF